MQYTGTFKLECAKNWYQEISIWTCARVMKDFCMPKSAQNLDVNIVLSNCSFVGVAAFESTYIVGHTEIRVVTFIFLHLQILFAKMQCKNAKMHAKLNT